MLSNVRGLVGDRTPVRLRRFAAVGAVSGGVQVLLLGAFVELLHVHYLPAALVAIELTILLQYVLNNSWTFRPSRHRTIRSYLAGLARTNLVRATAMPLQLAILYVLVAWGNLLYLASNVVAIAIAGVYRYYLDSRWTWQVTQGS